MFGVTHSIPIFGVAGAKTGKKYAFAAGTYVGSGAATAAIVTTGFRKVHHVWMSNNGQGYASAATTDIAALPKPCLAAGTPGSFYPIVGYIDKGAAVNHSLGIGSAATFRWLALVDDE